MTGLRLLAVLFSACLLSSCASSPKIHTATDPGADFARYRSFAFEPRLGTDRPDGTASILSAYLKDATRSEMKSRGYVLDPKAPDLWINFYLETEEKIQSYTVPSAGPGVGYYGYRSGYYGAWSGYDTQVTQYTEGTLNIDLVEARRDQLVWEGVAVGRIQKSTLGKLDEVTPVVVAEIFQAFPYRAGGAPAPTQP